MRYLKLYEAFEEESRVKDNLEFILVELKDKGFGVGVHTKSDITNGKDDIDIRFFFVSETTFEYDDVEDYVLTAIDYIDERYVYDIKIQYMDTNLSLVHKTYSEFLEDIPSNIKLLIFDFNIK